MKERLIIILLLFAAWSCTGLNAAVPSDSLRRHPYIGGYREAEAIVLLRENYPADSLSVGLIRRAGILPEEDMARLERCLIAEP